jgi:hypothetical protein
MSVRRRHDELPQIVQSVHHDALGDTDMRGLPVSCQRAALDDTREPITLEIRGRDQLLGSAGDAAPCAAIWGRAYCGSELPQLAADEFARP